MEEKNYRSDCHCEHIKGIKCNVDTCYYHDGACDCTAHEVSVGSVGECCADCSDQTLCATFKPKDNQ